MAASSGPDIVDSGLVLALDAGDRNSYNSGISTTAWNDLSGRGNTGTLTNGPTYSSMNGGSIVFDGTNDVVSIPSNSIFDFNTSFTMSIWIKRNGDAGQTEEVFLHRESGASPVGGYQVYINRTSLLPTVRIRSNTNSVDTLTGSTAISSTWVYLTFVYSSPTLQIYQNGISVGNKTSSVTSIGSVSNNLSVGGVFGGGVGYAWNGNIAQVSIYNRALSATEIQQNFNAVRSRFGI